MKVDTYMCPECGADVPVGSRGCPACGPRKVARRMRRKKVKRQSWEQDESYDGLDLPDDDFDYEEFVDREFGNKPHKTIGIAWYWWLTALALLIFFAWFSLGF